VIGIDPSEVVGAAGFEPATPCAQGMLSNAPWALKWAQHARFSKSCNQICDHPSRDVARCAVSDGDAAYNSRVERRTRDRATISIDVALMARLTVLAAQTGQSVDEFVDRILCRIAGTDMCVERGVPVFPRRPGAPALTVDEVDRLANGE
jgi:hypothetical protein